MGVATEFEDEKYSTNSSYWYGLLQSGRQTGSEEGMEITSLPLLQDFLQFSLDILQVGRVGKDDVHL